MKKKLIGLFLCLFVTASMAASINKIVMFGDSVSDTGNLYEQMQHRFPPSPPYYKGRFSNGPLWIEHVVSHYYPSDSESHFNNYAFAGTGVESEDEEIDEFMSGFNAQIRTYLQLFDDKVDDASLFVVWTGSNNYVGILSNEDEAVDMTVSGIKRGIDKLAKKGAKHIMLINLPDLGMIPLAREDKIVEMLSYVSRQHNKKLLDAFEALKADYPDVKWLYFDGSQRFLDVMNYPDVYGLENVTDACQKVESDLTHCDRYLFFDLVHLSGRAHKEVGKGVIAFLDEAGVKFG